MPIRPVDNSVFLELERDIDQEVLAIGAIRYVVSDVVAVQGVRREWRGWKAHQTWFSAGAALEFSGRLQR